MTTTFDVIVVGAGPGGIAAASVAAEAGMKVCLVDSQATLGGQIWRGFSHKTGSGRIHSSQFSFWSKRLHASNCTSLAGWHVVASPAAGVLRVESEAESRDLHFEKLILATGARERFLPFPGWTLPGVMGVGGLQAFLKSGLDARGKRVVIAGTGPLLLAVAASARQAGARIAEICEQAEFSRLASFGLRTLFSHPGKLWEGAGYRLATRSSAYSLGVWVTRAEGKDCVEQVSLSDGRRNWTVPCDWLACGYHLVPNLELPQLLGCRIAEGSVVTDDLQMSSIDGVYCAGELTGIGGLDKSIIEGQIAGWAATGRPIEARRFRSRRRSQMHFAQSLQQTFALRTELRNLPAPETLVCRCEDVPHAELKHCTSGREAKLHTRCGMGVCQGRICSAATEFLYGWQSSSQRPPLFPARIETLRAPVTLD
jgi:NADPH-dependent 2,4-dienoyl-CoA reductase/sulfur reductase-like enzyme